MSWSIYVVGRAPAVLKKVREDLAKITCAEPEETIKKKVGDILEASLLAMADIQAVKIEAAGSQTGTWDAMKNESVPGKYTNTVTLKIEPLYGFVE